MTTHSKPATLPPLDKGKKALYISDMDGTLLGSDSKVSPLSVQMLNELTRLNVMFTVATARTPATVQPLMQQVEQGAFTDSDGVLHPLPSIVMTGAALWDRRREAFQQISLIPENDVHVILQAFSKAGIHPFVYCLSGNNFLNVYHPAAMTSREDSFYQERRHLQLKRFHLNQEPANFNHVAIIFAIGSLDGVKEVTRHLQGATECAAAWYPDIFLPSTGLMDIYAPGVNKASAVKAMRELTGADEVVVFGDNLNDIPMMRVADLAVAVDNALPEVKDAAHVVIGPNTANSVPAAILRRHNPSNPLLAIPSGIL